MYNNTGNEYAYAGLNIPISSANINGTGLMLNERVKYSCTSNFCVISTANPYLDGDARGTYGSLLTATGNGYLIKRITIKARGTTTQGIIRFFIQPSTTPILIREVEVPAVVQSAEDETLIVILDEFIYLKTNFLLKVSTEKAESFVVLAEAVEMTYPA